MFDHAACACVDTTTAVCSTLFPPSRRGTVVMKFGVENR